MRINDAPLATDTQINSNPTTQIPTGFVGDLAVNFEQLKNYILNKIGFAPFFDSGKGQAIDLNSVDLNSLEAAGYLTSGLYFVENSCSNKPAGTSGNLFWGRSSINEQFQLFFAPDGEMFFRIKTGFPSAWSGWVSSGSGAVSSVFGRTGAVAAANGDYDFSKIGGSTAVALTSGASIALTTNLHTLTTALSAITFTISFTSDFITIELTLNATSSTFTFPATALCVAEGVASGSNLLNLSGTSGDKYLIQISKIGLNYYVVSKNMSH